MSKSQMNGFKKQLDERRLEREKVEISLLSKVVSSRDLLGLHGRSASHRFYDGFIPSLMTVMVNAHHVQKKFMNINVIYQNINIQTPRYNTSIMILMKHVCTARLKHDNMPTLMQAGFHLTAVMSSFC